MKLLLIPNLSNAEELRQAEDCIRRLDAIGEQCFLPGSLSDRFGTGRCIRDAADADLILSLGGDGAVLRAAQTAFRFGKPLLGIHTGRLGHLCAVDPDALRRMDVLLPSLRLSQRTLLRLDTGEVPVFALNDIVIGREEFGETVDLDLAVDGRRLHSFRGDGMILSTATGSTSYNRSAGGPILMPEMDCILITPICPQSRGIPPLVVPGESRITVSVSRTSHRGAGLYADGRPLGPLGTITVGKAGQRLKLYMKPEPQERSR